MGDERLLRGTEALVTLSRMFADDVQTCTGQNESSNKTLKSLHKESEGAANLRAAGCSSHLAASPPPVGPESAPHSGVPRRRGRPGR